MLKKKGDMGKVRAKTQPGWRHTNGALGGTTCTGTWCGQPVNHTPGLTPLEPARSVYQGREGRKKKKKRHGKAGWQSRTSHLSPSSDLRMFSCLSKKDKRYDCSGMKTRVTFKQRKAETAVSDSEGNVNQPWEAFDIGSLSAEVMVVFCGNK